jgi:hypothetical protein
MADSVIGCYRYHPVVAIENTLLMGKSFVDGNLTIAIFDYPWVLSGITWQ